MAGYRLSNGEYLVVDHASSTDEWEYWLFNEDGTEIDGGAIDDDHYPQEFMVVYDIATDRGADPMKTAQIPDSKADWFFDYHGEEPDDGDLEVGYNPYIGCYDYDC